MSARATTSAAVATTSMPKSSAAAAGPPRLREPPAPDQDRHAERARAARDFLADVAEADKAERPAVAGRAPSKTPSCSTARAQLGDVVGNAPIDRQDQRERQLGDGDRVLARTVRHVDAAARRAATSIVLTPAPARTISDSPPASSIASVTCVERTTSTCAPARASAWTRRRRSGPARRSRRSRRPSGRRSRTCSNLSAIRTFMMLAGRALLVGREPFVGRAPLVESSACRDQIRCDSRPSRSFGSNQVDFGGMMPPASAMRIRSSTVTGNSENATANCSGVDEPLELARCRGCRRQSRCACRCARPRCRESARESRSAAGRRRATLPPAGITSVYHRPARYIATSPLRAGVAGPPSRTVSRRFSAARNSAAVNPFRSFTTRL